MFIPYEEAKAYSALTKYYSQRSADYLNFVNSNGKSANKKKLSLTKFPKKFLPLIKQIRSYYTSKLDLLTPGKVANSKSVKKNLKNVGKATSILFLFDTPELKCAECMSTVNNCTFCFLQVGIECCDRSELG